MIIAILIFSTAPVSSSKIISEPQDLIGILFSLIVFWLFNKYHFSKLRRDYDNEIIDVNQAKRIYFSTININTIIAIFLFTIEIFIFDLKIILSKIPFIGNYETIINISGITFFLIQLSIIWYLAFKSMGNTIQIANSPSDYIRANIKFNLAIVVPYLFLLIVFDLVSIINRPWLTQIMNSTYFQDGFFIFFLLLIGAFAPILITYLWDCEPLPESEIKDSINSFCLSQRVTFKKVMSWNALNKGLVTAGVIGVFPSFRYLLITPALMSILNRDEILAVASHEVGHVKKKHLILYFLFFIWFIKLSFEMVTKLLDLFIRTKFGLALIVSADGTINYDIQRFLWIILFVILLIIYVRFVFGYFMRNFERQADVYCFNSGINPDHLISSFVKLGSRIGIDTKKSNWHHYNISQRINFLKKCSENPETLIKHKKKVNRSLTIFIIVMIILTIISFNLFSTKTETKDDFNLWANIIYKKIQKSPKNKKLYNTLAMLYFQMEKWEQYKWAYEMSLKLDYQQPEILNNLAWLLLTCPDKKFLNSERALTLAKDAAKFKITHHILDTLAEAYYKNFMFREAFLAARKALKIADKDQEYYKKQLEKMKNALKESRSTIKI